MIDSKSSDEERFRHHGGNLVAGALFSLALLWGAAWMSTLDPALPMQLNIMRWVTVFVLVTAAVFFALIACIGGRRLWALLNEKNETQAG